MKGKQATDPNREPRMDADDAASRETDAAPETGDGFAHDEEDLQDARPAARRTRSVVRLERGDAAASYESLPVLAAFRDFIEIERKRTRNSMVVIASFFVIVLGLMIALGLVLGLSYMNRMKGDINGTHADVGAVAGELLRTRDQTEAAIQKLTAHATRLQDQVRAGSLAADMALQQATSQSDIFSDKMAKIAEMVKALEAENKVLRSRMETAQASSQPPTNPPAPAVPPPMAAAKPAIPAAPPPTVAAAGSSTASNSATANSMTLVVVPRGLSRAVRWRVPIPE